MRLPWLVLLLFPLFRCRIIPPDLNFSGFRTGTIAAVVVIFRFRRYHAILFSRSYGVMRSPFPHFPLRTYAPLPTSTIGTIPVRAYFTLPSGSARDRIFFNGEFYAQTPNTALFSPRQNSRSGIHSAVLNHDSFIRSCENVAIL